MHLPGTRSRARFALLMALLMGLLTAVACGEPDDSGGGFNLPPTDTGAGLFDSGGSADGGTGGSDADQPDTSQPDGAGGAGSVADAPSFCPGQHGCPCQDNVDCDNDTCIDTPEGRRCARKCVDTCPESFACKQLPGADASFYCLPRWLHVCAPCATSATCSAPGFSGGACVDRGPQGSFCGTACDDSGDCPNGYACALVTSVEGTQSQQCLPKGGAECGCSPLASKLKLTTACEVKLDAGTCQGTRSCGPEGLSPCDAKPSKEACNGADDDCDGLTDEALCDDANVCTTDLCDPALQLNEGCTHTAAPGGCDADGNACTESDACAGGVCKAGKVKDCDDSNPCTLDACLPASGCSQKPDDGKACSDGDACTVGDVCAGGACKVGPPKVCKPGGFCVTAACDKTSGACKDTPKTQGTPCSDDNQCTQKDACDGGSCVGEAIVCDDKNICTLDSCDPKQGCQTKTTTAPCDDGDACTQGDVCSGGTCKPGAPKVCKPGVFCVTAACDKGSCKQSAKPGGTPCSDDNQCTQKDACKDGNCVGVAIVCDDKNPCTADSCDPKQGCQSKPTTAPCDDGNACTAADVCSKGLCVGQVVDAKVWCDDGNPCTTDTCDPKATSGTPKKGCKHAANKQACDDGNACTSGDVCSAGACKPGTNTCQCNKDSDCAAKEDGDLCNGTLFCDKGALPYKCAVNPKTIVTCSKAGDSACKAAKCAPKTGKCGLAPTNEGQSCDADGSVCTVGDLCLGGDCKPGKALTCDDGNPCTKDNCDAKKGCVFTKLADKTACGTTQWCIAGACVTSAWCGDGKVNQGSEECDDGNKTSGDGCSDTCKKEAAVVPSPGTLVITEIMADPNVKDTVGEWVEVRNVSKLGLKITGLELRDNAGKTKVIKTGVVLQPGAYFVFGTKDDLGGGGVANHVYNRTTTNLALSNKGDVVSVWFSGQQLDQVKYGGKDWGSVPAGASYQLSSDQMTASANDSGKSWCVSKVAYNTKSGDKGTPGKANVICP